MSLHGPLRTPNSELKNSETISASICTIFRKTRPRTIDYQALTKENCTIGFWRTAICRASEVRPRSHCFPVAFGLWTVEGQSLLPIMRDKPVRCFGPLLRHFCMRRGNSWKGRSWSEAFEGTFA